MVDKIEPALSREDWARVEASGGPIRHDDACRESGDPKIAAYLIALNNAALPDSDPRKITPDMVSSLRYSANYGDSADKPLLDRLADALESYLPPGDG